MNKKNAFSAKRRQFFGAAGAATLAAGVIGLEPVIGDSQAQAAAVGLPSNKRRARAEKIRLDLAIQNKLDTPTRLEHPTNPDDDLYADKRGSYTKGLPHNADGTVVPAAYRSLVGALADGQGNPQLFNTIQLSNPASFPFGGRKLTNPQAGLAFEVEGRDAHSYIMPPAPAFASREECAEIAENYWMALLRDLVTLNFQLEGGLAMRQALSLFMP